MRLIIRGHHLPGLTCGSYRNIHVGLQVKSQPVDLVPADAAAAEWVAEIRTDDGDFRGPAVQGKKGERFVYLTWGTVDGDSFSMFRRAKLMLAVFPSMLLRSPSTSISPMSLECHAALGCASRRSGSIDCALLRHDAPNGRDHAHRHGWRHVRARWATLREDGRHVG